MRVALLRITEEFVRHHRLLVERTKNNASAVLAALDEYPELAASIERLHESEGAIDWHRKFGRRRFIVQAHEEFRIRLLDFGKRWASAYDELRGRTYQQAMLRISREFTRLYALLIERTGDDPSAIASMREQQAELDDAIILLESIDFALDDPLEYAEQVTLTFGANISHFVAKVREMSRYVPHAPPEFHDALADFKGRWARACAQPVKEEVLSLDDLDLLSLDDLTNEEGVTLASPEVGASAVGKPSQNWLGELLNSLPDAPTIEGPPTWNRLSSGGPFSHILELRQFDPDRDRAADVIWWFKDLCERQPELAGEYLGYSAAGAFKWMHETVGLDLDEIERRWKEFPVIVVPQHVSDKYGLEQPHGLYRYLTQVRLAYIIGADLAEIALCRSVTELLIRYHYASDIPGAENSRGKYATKLTWLIKQVQDRQDLDFLRNFNLVEKVDAANDILHQPNTHIEHRNRARGLATEWVRVLEEMIDHAPARRTSFGE
jgi:hypothetical protein